ncbi:MAG: hypothetical protein ATN35_09995 [Epulopiscium sp. Nele67-Bin004]|nr:MAG: hypothetical protein ATN35_09995 [Epulopiscium sp. Nele67-Bin004]
MNHNEYIRKLSKHLKFLKYSERLEVLAYYREYLAESGENDPVKLLGTPEQLAKQILSDGDSKINRGSFSPLKLIVMGFAILNPFTLVAVLMALVAVLMVGIGAFTFVGIPIIIVASVVFAIIVTICFGWIRTLLYIPKAFGASFSLGFSYIGIALMEMGVFLLFVVLVKTVFGKVRGR